MSCIPTYSGHLVDLHNPDPATIDIVDIGIQLSRIPRWNAACHGRLSVAQHCVWVCDHVPIEHRFVGLMHDAAEAYLGDLAKPVKDMLGRTWQMIEDRLLDVIGRKYGVDLVNLPESVRAADDLARVTEARDFIRAPLSFATGPHPDPLAAVSDQIALADFMQRFNELDGNGRAARAAANPPTSPQPRSRRRAHA